MCDLDAMKKEKPNQLELWQKICFKIMAKVYKKSKRRKEGKDKDKDKGGERSGIETAISIGSNSKQRGGCVSSTTIGINLKKKKKTKKDRAAVKARVFEDDGP